MFDYRHFYAVNKRYDTINGEQKTYIKYTYNEPQLGFNPKTIIDYYGDYDASYYEKRKIYYFDADNHNTKIETYLNDNPYYKEIQTFSYNFDMPDKVVTLYEDSSNSWSKTQYIQYNEYATPVKVFDSEGGYSETDIKVHTQSESGNKYEFLESNLTKVSLETGEYEYLLETFEDNGYGSTSKATTYQCNYGYDTIIRKDIASGELIDYNTKDKSILFTLPSNISKMDFNIYWQATWSCHVGYEVYCWSVGEEKPTEPNYSNYHSYWLPDTPSSDTDSFTIYPDDLTKPYYLEIKAWMTGGSMLRVDDINVTYTKRNFSEKDIKYRRYYKYINPSTFSKPSVVHEEYGSGGNLHSNEFDSDSCIKTEYLYQAENFDGVCGLENYVNLLPTGITQYYYDKDHILKTKTTNLRYNRYGQITYVKQGDIEKSYVYDNLNRLNKEIYFGTVNGTSQELNKTYSYSLEPDIDGLYTTKLSHQTKDGAGADKHITTFYYNQAGQHVKTTNGPEGVELLELSKGYDGFGRLQYTKDAENIKTLFYYDGYNRTTKIEQYNSSGTRKGYTLSTYDDAARTVIEQVYDGNILKSNKTSYLDKLGNVSRHVNYLSTLENAVTSFEYNYAGQLTKVTDPRNLTLSYEYNYFGINKIIYPGSIRNDRGSTDIYTHYDELDRVKKIVFPDGRVQTMDYNLSGLLKDNSIRNATEESSISYTYDKAGNIFATCHTYDEENYSISYIRDEKGNITGITYPNGLTIRYIYDNYGRIIRIPGLVEKAGGLAGIKYLDNGFVDSIIFKNGIETKYVPDSLYRVAQIKSAVMDYRYSFDFKGNVKSFSDYDPLDGQLILYRSYSYNFLDWLEKDTRRKNLLASTEIDYDYDKVGNRLEKTVVYEENIPTIPEPINPITPLTVNPNSIDSIDSADDGVYGYSDTDLNLLTSVNNKSITYDPWGNINTRQDTEMSYTFNSSNQLTGAHSSSKIYGTYYYNPEGKRYKKVENNAITYYVSEGENLLYEKRDDGTEICYIYLNGIPVARIEEDPANNRTEYFYHTDHLGSTRVVTNASGNIVAEYEYDVFGYPTDVITNESLAFTAKGQDATGLYYFNARYYDPKLGRFISEDPAKDGSNWYQYCGNNPLKYVDIDGKKKVPHNALMGMLAHKVIQAEFLSSDLSKEKFIEYRFSNGFRADMVLIKRSYVAVGEIKPDSYDTNAYKKKLAIRQVNTYIKLAIDDFGMPAKGLTIFKATNIPIHGTSWSLNVYQNPNDPGLYYYWFDDGEEEGSLNPTKAEYRDIWDKYKIAIATAAILAPAVPTFFPPTIVDPRIKFAMY